MSRDQSYAVDVNEAAPCIESASGKHEGHSEDGRYWYCVWCSAGPFSNDYPNDATQASPTVDPVAVLRQLRDEHVLLYEQERVDIDQARVESLDAAIAALTAALGTQVLTAGDSDNPTGALNTHGQTGTCLEHGSQLSSGKGHAGISPSASGQSDQGAERPAVNSCVKSLDDWLRESAASCSGCHDEPLDENGDVD